jgi:hypothetical protein
VQGAGKRLSAEKVSGVVGTVDDELFELGVEVFNQAGWVGCSRPCIDRDLDERGLAPTYFRNVVHDEARAALAGDEWWL